MKKGLLLQLAFVTFFTFPILCFGQAPNLGTAASFALFTANGAFTNVGATTVTGDIGTNIGAFSGFPPGTVIGQTRLPGSTQADQAATDITAAYNALTAAPCGTTIGPLLGNGQTITSGVYCQSAPAAASTLNGTLVLDGPGTFIIKLNGALTTTAGSSISLINGASWDNVYFQVNGAVDLGVGSHFKGTILANGAISLLTGASLEGRGLSIAGAISLSNNIVTNVSPALAVAVTPGTCSSANNAYSLAGTLSLTAAVASVITITDGTASITLAISAGQPSAAFGLSNLTSGTGVHTVTASGAGYNPVSASYTAPASCTVAVPLASLSGTVYADINTNGVQDGGDTSLAGVTVTLLDGSNSPVSSTTTNSGGLYSFTGLTLGVPYSVSITTPANYSSTGSNVSGPVTLTASATTIPARGFTPLTSSLSGSVYADNNKNGVQDGGDTPLGGVSVALVDGANVLIASTTSSPSGLYSFTGLTTGATYSVGLSTPANYSATGSNVSGPVTLTASTTTLPAKGFTPLTSSLGGAVYADNNKNGVQDGGDTPLGGVTVTLLNGSNAPILSTTTSPAGLYSFTGLTPGTPYSVSISTPANYSTTNANGIAGPITLTPGQNNSTLSAGYYPLTSVLTVAVLVDKSTVKAGDVLTYTLVLTNAGNSPATNVVVNDSASVGLTYVANSAVVPTGTTFTPGTPISNWTISTINGGQSFSLTFQARADSAGILYNTAIIPGDTVKVCTSVPAKLCPGDQYILSVPAGRASYRWYKNGVLIPGQTGNELVVTAPGSYSLGVDNAGSQCPDFSCCPFIVEADSLPAFKAVATTATCLTNTPQANGQLTLTNFKADHTYQYSLGASFNSAASLSGAGKPIPANGVIAATLPNPVTAQPYTVRVFNSAGCYTDVTVVLVPTVCGCPILSCVPVIVQRTRRVVR